MQLRVHVPLDIKITLPSESISTVWKKQNWAQQKQTCTKMKHTVRQNLQYQVCKHCNARQKLR